jgi:hypothetical protein
MIIADDGTSIAHNTIITVKSACHVRFKILVVPENKRSAFIIWSLNIELLGRLLVGKNKKAYIRDNREEE